MNMYKQMLVAGMMLCSSGMMYPLNLQDAKDAYRKHKRDIKLAGIVAGITTLIVGPIAGLAVWKFGKNDCRPKEGPVGQFAVAVFPVGGTPHSVERIELWQDLPFGRGKEMIGETEGCIIASSIHQPGNVFSNAIIPVRR